jgi:hypothetical protein
VIVHVTFHVEQQPHGGADVEVSQRSVEAGTIQAGSWIGVVDPGSHPAEVDGDSRTCTAKRRADHGVHGIWGYAGHSGG